MMMMMMMIKLKICTLTYKLLSVNQPANPRLLITSYVPPRLLRSSDQCLLTQPQTPNLCVNLVLLTYLLTYSSMHWPICFQCLRAKLMELTTIVY